MMDEEVDIEDGEVVDYTPLPRPVACGPVGTTDMGYSDNSADENDSLDSNSGNDSDSPHFRPVKPKKKHMSVKSVHQTDRNKKYDVWSSELQESALTEELVNCDVRQKSLDRSRAVETYDYSLAYRMDDQQDHNADNFESEPRESLRGLKRRYEDRGSVKLRLGPRPTNGDEFDTKGSPRNIFDLNVTIENTNEEVANDIANKLCEEKDDLILKVVEVLGKEKAMDLFRETKKIEENGGLMVLNNSRRRTPGGVFLLLVKKDNDIQQEKLNMIFHDERKKRGQMRRISISQSRKAKTEELRRSLSADGLLRERDLPALLNRTDLQLEQHNKHIETDGETAVTNPPPSPATDGRENSSDGVPELSEQLSNRQLNCYNDDDFLDVACDNMDVF